MQRHHNPTSNNHAGIARIRDLERLKREAAPPVLMADGALRVALVAVPFCATPVELDTIALVVLAAVQVENVYVCAVVVPIEFDGNGSVTIAIVEIDMGSRIDVLVVSSPPPKPSQIKATATTPAKDSHVSSLLYGILSFSFEQAKSLYVAQSA
jgi:hypothetical protein